MNIEYSDGELLSAGLVDGLRYYYSSNLMKQLEAIIANARKVKSK